MNPRTEQETTKQAAGPVREQLRKHFIFAPLAPPEPLHRCDVLMAYATWSH